jgi:hypothetical protein
MHMATKPRLQKLLDLAAKFVIDQKGAWSHEEWLVFVGKAAALGIETNDETKRRLGNILESCKHLYSEAEDAPPEKKPAAKPKARAKRQ